MVHRLVLDIGRHKSNGRGEPFKYSELEGYDFLISVPPKGSLELLERRYEVCETWSIVNRMRPGDIVVDAGACIGFFTCLCAKMAGLSGRVVAIEPEPSNLAYLRKNVSTNGFSNVEIFEGVVTDRIGRENLYFSPDENNYGAHCIWKPSKGNGKFIEVSSTTIDDLCEDLPRVDFIKLDVQGSEIRALQGAEKTINRNPHIAMLVEYSTEDIREMGNSAKEFFDLIRSYGFTMFIMLRTVYPDGMITVGFGNFKKHHTLASADGGESVVNFWCLKEIIPNF